MISVVRIAARPKIIAIIVIIIIIITSTINASLLQRLHM
jgi:hypothetical protein